MDSRLVVRNAVVLGLALFAMFFGAGNLIFPPSIGLQGGTDWVVGFLAYFVTDVGLATISILAMLRNDGVMTRVTGSVGKVPAVVLNTVVMLCIGPLLAIPRTAATSFEMGASALGLGGGDSSIMLAIFSVVFFLVVFATTMNPSKVVSSIGGILTPALVVFLAILIVAGVAFPAAEPQAPLVNNLVEVGILNGYQTLDVLAALVFSIIIVQTVKGFGCTSEGQKNGATALACCIAGGLLLLVYGGLAYLGATTGQLWSAEYSAGAINQAGLLSNIAGAVFGDYGAMFLAIIVLFACLTTAIGLVSCCAEYFQELLGGRLSYRAVALITCVFSAVLCNVGLAQIISISAPILMLVYPVAMFLALASLFRTPEGPGKLACRLGAVVALASSFCSVLSDTFGVTALGWVSTLPLGEFGLYWVVPTLVAALVGIVVERLMKGKRNE